MAYCDVKSSAKGQRSQTTPPAIKRRYIGGMACDARAQRLLGGVVGGRNGAVFEEDEQVPPAAGDRLLQLDACCMGRGQAHERVELDVEGVGVGAQRGVGEVGAPSGDGASALEQLAQGGGEDDVAGIDGVGRIADEMGEAGRSDLLRCRRARRNAARCGLELSRSEPGLQILARSRRLLRVAF